MQKKNNNAFFKRLLVNFLPLSCGVIQCNRRKIMRLLKVYGLSLALFIIAAILGQIKAKLFST